MVSKRLLFAVAVASACAPSVTDEQSQALTGPDGGGNRAPVAIDDSISTDAGQGVAIYVLANDSDPDGDPLVVSPTGSASWPFLRTTFDCSSDGYCWVDAYPHESGTGWFGYQACDPEGLCAEAIVNVTIRHIATQPYAEDDTATTDLDTPVSLFILANDNANGGWLDASSIAVSNGPWYGTVDVDPWDGLTTYTPNSGYRGSDVFQYQVCNADLLCSSAYVFVFVDPTAPVVARADQLPTLYWYETPTPLPILDNDLTPGVWVVTTALVPPAHGDYYTDWTVHYNPYPDYTGPDELVYQVCTPFGCAASLARMSARVNHSPTIVPDHVITDEDNPIVFNALANDTDPDGDPLHLNWPCYEGPDWWFFRGQLSCSINGDCTFSPAPQEFGEATILCDVCDIAEYCVTEEVPLTVLHVPNPPECYDDAFSTVEDTPVDFRVVLNDAFNGGRPWYPTLVFNPEPAHGTWVNDEDFGITTYTPNANYTGADTFAYTLCDVYGLCCSAGVTVTITPGDNDPPVFTADADNTAQTISKTGVPVPLRATDPDDTVLTFIRVSGTLPDGITLRSDGTFASTRHHRRGTYVSTIRVSDPAGQSATTTLAITVD